MKLLNALKKGNVALAQRLIKQGNLNEINAKDANGLSPLHICALKGLTEIAETLLTRGAKLNATAHFKYYTFMTPLHIAALIGDARFVKLLIAWGANSNLETGEYLTPCQIAIQENHMEVARLLVHKNSYPNIHSSLYQTYPTADTIQEMMTKRLIELKHASHEMNEARSWLQKNCKAPDNVIDFSKYHLKKRLSKSK